MNVAKLRERALATVSRLHRLDDPVVVDQVEGWDKSGRPAYWFTVVSAKHGNGKRFVVGLDGDGEHLDDALPPAPPVAPVPAPAPLAMAAVTIDPAVNNLTLNPGQAFDEVLTVTVPKSAGAAKLDVYFLADTTASMGSYLAAVQAGAGSVLSALTGLGVDIAFGVGNYKDFGSGDPFGFQHQVAPTTLVSSVTAAINSWTATGGKDLPEANLFALQSIAEPPGATIGWRSGSRRIVVWFGDAAGHDPVCAAMSGAGFSVTEASATTQLVAESIAVLAISTATPGLDADPKASAIDYTATCGAPGGSAGQASRIAAATGGSFVTGINPSNIVTTIISLVTAAVGIINNLKLVPSPAIAPFVTSIAPAGGYGPLAGDQEHVLRFEVRFTGIPCRPEPQVVGGSIDVVADGAVVAAKQVQITVPACRPRFVYSVKFVCGVQADGCGCGPLAPGSYATEINIHNPTSREVHVEKRFIPVVLAGAPAGRSPKVAAARASDEIVLPPHSATFDDCCRIAELLYGAPGGSPIPLSIGLLELSADANIAVTAVYTSSAAMGGVALSIEQIDPQRG